MKSLSEYNSTELLQLTDVDIEKTIDFMCAIEGIPLLPDSPTPPAEVAHNKDVVIYYISDFGFSNEDDAKQVADLINSKPLLKDDYDYSLGYDYHYASGDDRAAASTPKRVMSLAEFDRLKSDFARYKAEKKTYEAKQKEYDNVYGMRSEIASRVWDKINDAREEQYAKQGAIKRFERYLGMADENQEMALKFFTTAYPDDVHYLSEYLSSLPNAVASE